MKILCLVFTFFILGEFSVTSLNCRMPCEVLEKILNSDKVISNCHFNRKFLETIYIVDTTNTFRHCEFSLLDRKAIVLKEYLKEEIFDIKTGRLNDNSKDRVDVLKCVRIDKGKYKLILLREIGGNVINCYFSFYKENITIEKIEIGNM